MVERFFPLGKRLSFLGHLLAELPVARERGKGVQEQLLKFLTFLRGEASSGLRSRLVRSEFWGNFNR